MGVYKKTTTQAWSFKRHTNKMKLCEQNQNFFFLRILSTVEARLICKYSKKKILAKKKKKDEPSYLAWAHYMDIIIKTVTAAVGKASVGERATC